MMMGKGEYRHGRIIGAFLTSSVTGKRELHPAAVLSPDSAIVQPDDFDPRLGGGRVRENEIVVIGISSRYKLHKGLNIPLPYSNEPRGHHQTRLTKDSAAIIGWYH